MTLQLGDRVRYSDHHTRRAWDQYLMAGDYQRKASLHRTWTERCERRGVVTAIVPSGYQIRWDDGGESSTIEYLVTRADPKER